MRREVQSVLFPVVVIAAMAGAAFAGWQIGAPEPQKVAAAVPPASVEPPAPEPETAATVPAELEPEPAPAPLTVAELPPVPEGPISDEDLQRAALDVPRQLAALAEETTTDAAPLVTLAAAETAVNIVLPLPEPPPLLVELPPAEEPVEVAAVQQPEPAVARPEPPVEEPAPAVAPPAKGPVVHLASYFGPRMATSGWKVLSSRAGTLLADAKPETRDAKIGGQRYVRLMARLPAGTDAAARCADLRRAGFYCMTASALSSQPARSAKAR